MDPPHVTYRETVWLAPWRASGLRPWPWASETCRVQIYEYLYMIQTALCHRSAHAAFDIWPLDVAVLVEDIVIVVCRHSRIGRIFITWERAELRFQKVKKSWTRWLFWVLTFWPRLAKFPKSGPWSRGLILRFVSYMVARKCRALSTIIYTSLFTRNGSIEKRNTKIQKYTIMKSESKKQTNNMHYRLFS